MRGACFVEHIVKFLSNILDNGAERAIINYEKSLFQGEVQFLTGGNGQYSHESASHFRQIGFDSQTNGKVRYEETVY